MRGVSPLYPPEIPDKLRRRDLGSLEQDNSLQASQLLVDGNTCKSKFTSKMKR